MRSLYPLLLVLVLFQCGSERLRDEQSHARSLNDLLEHKSDFLWPPWNLLRAYVSRDSDERVYFEWTRLILGEEADLPFLARQQLGQTEATLALLEDDVSRHPGVRLPYRDISIGYPPLAFLLFMAPRLVTHTLSGYRLAFGILVSLLHLLDIWLGLCLLRGWERRPSDFVVLRRAAVATFCLGPILIARFDILPAVLCTAALLLLCRNRPISSAIFLLLGGATKLYPLLLLPVWTALLFGWGGADRLKLRTLLLTLLLALISGAVVLAGLTGHGLMPLLQSVFLYGDRPFQIESQVGGVALAIFGKGAVVGSYASFNSVFPGGAFLSAIWQPLMVASLLVIALLAGLWARANRHLSTQQKSYALFLWTTGTLLWILATSKVLSPQYLIWCFPLVLLVPGIFGKRLYVTSVIVLCLTQLCYPFLYAPLRDGALPVVALLIARNLLLLILAITALRRARASTPGDN